MNFMSLKINQKFRNLLSCLRNYLSMLRIQKKLELLSSAYRGIEEYEYENIHRKNLKGNIYLGKVSRIEPSLQAV